MIVRETYDTVKLPVSKMNVTLVHRLIPAIVIACWILLSAIVALLPV